VSEIGARLWADYQEFASRDLSEYDITYLFVDGIAERLRPGQRREPVLAAWGHTSSGAKVLLHLMAGSKEDAETVSAFFQDMRARGLGDPLLVVSDGAPGIVKALESCFPRSERQRCLAHRMRNLAAKVPEDRWPEFKARATACYQAPSRAIARDLAAGVVADFETELATAVRCFTDDFEACIAHLRMPVSHRRAIRTTDEIDKPFFVFREALKRAPERPPPSLAKARLGHCRGTVSSHGRPRGEEQGWRMEALPRSLIVAPPLRRPCARLSVGAAAIG
jgi:putative transposase